MAEADQSSTEKRKKYRTLFTSNEDSLLRTLVDKYGDQEWEKISEELPSRSARQCRERWINYLSPELNQGPWSPEEDSVLYRKVHKYGKRWEDLVHFFPGRSRNDLKNRWNTVVRKGKMLGFNVTSITDFLNAAGKVETRKRNKGNIQPRVPIVITENPQELYKIANLLVS